MKFHFFSVFVLSFSLATSQVKFDVKVSEKHLQKVEQSKDARQKLTSYKKYYQKDSIKAAKKEWKVYKKEKRDSLKTEGLWKEAKDNKQKILSNKWERYTNQIPDYELDTLAFPVPKDSLDWALQELAKQKNFQELQSIYEELGQYDSAYLDQFNLDSIKIDTTELINRFELKERMSNYLPEELQSQSDANIVETMKYGAIDEFGAIHIIDRSGVEEFFKNIDPEEFAKSQLSLQSLKEKYVKLPNLEKEEKGIKRNSLRGSPLKKRFFLGGHFTVQSTSPFVIDSDIRPGFRVNKKFSLGAGFIVRKSFTSDSLAIVGDAYGYSFFADYSITEAFFFTTEYQSQKEASIFQETNQSVPWQRAYLAGIGKSFSLSSKAGASVSFLYDFNYKNNTLNVRPFQVRIGYKIGF